MARADFFTPETIQRFAPLLVLQKAEDNSPASAQWFLDRSALEFSESDPCSNETIYPGPWSQKADAKLGLSVPLKDRWQYRDKLFPLCHHSGQTLFATEDTRPFDSRRIAGLHADEGFFLGFNGSAQGMAFSRDRSSHEFMTSAPIYYDDGELLGGSGTTKRPRLAYITYWFFYAYNDAPRVPFLFDHQGDWENMSLLFEQSSDGSGNWALKQVAYAAHGAPKVRPAACPDAVYATEPLDCPAPRELWHGTPRLVGFVANGDHATYASPGGHPLHLGVKDLTSPLGTGFAWLTWQALLPLDSQPWAGFCGAWGNVGASVFETGLAWAEDRTGPLGPGCLDKREMPLKTGRPEQWGVSRSSPLDREAKPGSAVGVGL